MNTTMTTERHYLGDDARFDELMNRLRAPAVGKSVSAYEWEEVVNFLEENILTEERIQKEYKCGYNTGREGGVAEIKGWLLGQAADAFIGGKDEDAKRLRDLANTLPSHDAAKVR